MPIVISPGFAIASWGTMTAPDPEPMYVTCAVDVSAAAGDNEVILDSLVGAWDQSIKSITSSATTLVLVQARVGQDGGEPIPIQRSVDIDGTKGGSLPPPNCAYLARKVTGLGGRKMQGRFYFPGIAVGPDLDSGGNIISNQTTYKVGVAGFFDECNTPSTSGAVATPMMLAHGDGSSWTPLTTVLGQDKLATQRRRMRP